MITKIIPENKLMKCNPRVPNGTQTRDGPNSRQDKLLLLWASGSRKAVFDARRLSLIAHAAHSCRVEWTNNFV